MIDEKIMATKAREMGLERIRSFWQGK